MMKQPIIKIHIQPKYLFTLLTLGAILISTLSPTSSTLARVEAAPSFLTTLWAESASCFGAYSSCDPTGMLGSNTADYGEFIKSSGTNSETGVYLYLDQDVPASGGTVTIHFWKSWTDPWIQISQLSRVNGVCGFNGIHYTTGANIDYRTFTFALSGSDPVCGIRVLTGGAPGAMTIRVYYVRFDVNLPTATPTPTPTLTPTPTTPPSTVSLSITDSLGNPIPNNALTLNGTGGIDPVLVGLVVNNTNSSSESVTFSLGSETGLAQFTIDDSAGPSGCTLGTVTLKLFTAICNVLPGNTTLSWPVQFLPSEADPAVPVMGQIGGQNITSSFSVPASAAPEAPQHSLSRYVGWTHVTTQADGTIFGEFRPNDFRELGCNQALSQAISQPVITDQVVVFAFGYPKVNNDKYGAVIYNREASIVLAGEITNVPAKSWFISNDNIEAATTAYINGFEYCRANSPIRVTLVLGLNNSAGDVTREHGTEWARMVDRIYNWMSYHDCIVSNSSGKCDARKYVYVAAGMDAESFEDETHTQTVEADLVRAWTEGYGDTMDALSKRVYYNFGTCDSCTTETWNDYKPYGDDVDQWVVHENTTWTYEDYWVLSNENRARPLPEIYAGGHALQWEWLRQYGLNMHERRMIFAGVMTQSGACSQTHDCDTTNSPEQGWRDLFNSMAPPIDKPRWSTDIFYMNNPSGN